jgi:hypothetical protein
MTEIDRLFNELMVVSTSCDIPRIRSIQTDIIQHLDVGCPLPTLTDDQHRMAVCLLMLHASGYVVDGPIKIVQDVFQRGSGTSAAELKVRPAVDGPIDLEETARQLYPEL